jgi:LPS O-antigen subunit length determinant protein (WzzB/FepE family)
MEEKDKGKLSLAHMNSSAIEIVKYVLSKWLLIFLIAFIFGCIGILYAWLKKPVYLAEMSFTAESESSSRIGAYAALAAQFGFDLGGGSNNIFEGDNLIELLKSRKLVVKTLLSYSKSKKRLMIDEYLDNNEIRKGWIKDEKLKNISFNENYNNSNRSVDSILTAVYKNIVDNQLNVFRKDKKLSIIIVQMKTNNEGFSKDFVELLASNAIQFYTEYKSKKARQNVDILQRQTDSVRQMLFGGISDVAVINDLNINPLRQISKTNSQKRQVDMQVNTLLYGELLKNLELSKLALRKETPLIQIIDNPILPLKKDKPGRLLTGILFAIVGSFACIAIVLLRRWQGKTRVIFAKTD